MQQTLHTSRTVQTRAMWGIGKCEVQNYAAAVHEHKTVAAPHASAHYESHNAMIYMSVFLIITVMVFVNIDHACWINAYTVVHYTL